MSPKRKIKSKNYLQTFNNILLRLLLKFLFLRTINEGLWNHTVVSNTKMHKKMNKQQEFADQGYQSN